MSITRSPRRALRRSSAARLVTPALLAAGAMLAIALPASAQDYQGGPPPGQGGPQPGAYAPRAPMSEGQFVESRVRHIMQADANHDGRVTLDEWMAWRAGRRGPEAARAEFERLDRNHVGYLTPDVLQAHEAKAYAHYAQRMSGGGGQGYGAGGPRGYGDGGQPQYAPGGQGQYQQGGPGQYAPQGGPGQYPPQGGPGQYPPQDQGGPDGSEGPQ